MSLSLSVARDVYVTTSYSLSNCFDGDALSAASEALDNGRAIEMIVNLCVQLSDAPSRFNAMSRPHLVMIFLLIMRCLATVVIHYLRLTPCYKRLENPPNLSSSIVIPLLCFRYSQNRYTVEEISINGFQQAAVWCSALGLGELYYNRLYSFNGACFDTV